MIASEKRQIAQQILNHMVSQSFKDWHDGAFEDYVTGEEQMRLRDKEGKTNMEAEQLVRDEMLDEIEKRFLHGIRAV